MNWFQRLQHKVFGTHYIAYEFETDIHIAKVRWMPNGRPYFYHKYEGIKFLDIPNPLHPRYRIDPLTVSSMSYFRLDAAKED